MPVVLGEVCAIKKVLETEGLEFDYGSYYKVFIVLNPKDTRKVKRGFFRKRECSHRNILGRIYLNPFKLVISGVSMMERGKKLGENLSSASDKKVVVDLDPDRMGKDKEYESKCKACRWD